MLHLTLTRFKLYDLVVCGIAGVAVAVIDNGSLDALIVGIACGQSFRFGRLDARG